MARPGRLLITGARGQLGTDLVAILSGQYDVAGTDLPELDICSGEAVRALVAEVKPDIVVHAAAMTDVDGCESNTDLAMAINADGTLNVARAAAERGARLIYFSTDYVFDGEKQTAYVETDTPAPRTVYGRSKLAGEEAVRKLSDDHAILRVSGVYGRTGKNFVRTMAGLGLKQIAKQEAGEAAPLRVVDDQVCSPTWTVDIVRQTMRVIDDGLRGTFHSTSEGEASWFQFASLLFEYLELVVEVEPCTTEEFPRPAPRPKRSILENERLKEAGANLMVDYRISLREFIRLHGKELKE
jgi:dTDP-4-dehydrorhamnose reductase